MSSKKRHIINEVGKSFVQKMKNSFELGEKLNRPQTEKIAKQYNITDKTKIKELTELSIVETARKIALSHESNYDKYQSIVDLYKIQTNISFRTSMSIMLQQYSTPAPIGFLMGLYCGIETGDKIVFEPSAGNGLLTIAAHPSKVVVNEIDDIRRANLYTQGYKEVIGQDASIEFRGFKKRFDAVITNPPFGRLDNPVYYDGFSISTLDHHMALIALSTMKVNGRAAIIIGGHTKWDEKGRVQKGSLRVFLNYLYSRYNVDDIIPINGSKLYSRQGTSFDTRLILIDGV
ncbi:MAG: hypothetical protein JKY09_08525, partial [Crocinitomicaceae bacterium]|nr:hypothetical protein [Crocinitomicaceae bacterium]